MGFFEMIVAVVLITTAGSAVEAHLKNQRRPRRSSAALEEALQQLRAEMAEMRRATHDVVLSFESTLQRLESRVQHLERTALSGASSPSAIPAGPASLPAPARSTEWIGGAL
jgi:hypothetical protein